MIYWYRSYQLTRYWWIHWGFEAKNEPNVTDGPFLWRWGLRLGPGSWWHFVIEMHWYCPEEEHNFSSWHTHHVIPPGETEVLDWPVRHCSKCKALRFGDDPREAVA